MDVARLKSLLGPRADAGAAPHSVMLPLLEAVHGPDTLDVILFGCLPHTLTPASLAAALPPHLGRQPADAFRVIAQLTFVKTQGPERITLHDEFRRAGRRQLYQRRREDFIAASARLAAVFAASEAIADVPEMLYHLLLADTSAALREILRYRRKYSLNPEAGCPQQQALYFRELLDLDPIDDAVRGEALVAQYTLQWPEDRSEGTLQLLREAVHCFQRTGHWLRAAQIANRLSHHYVQKMRVPEALACSAAAEAALGNVDPADDPEARLWKLDAEAALHNQRGNAHMAAENRSGALQHFRRDIALSTELAALSGNDIDQRGLAVAYQNLGIALLGDPGREAEAKDAFEAEFRLTAELAKKHPRDLAMQQDLVVSYGSMGQLAAAQNDQTRAEELYRAAIDLSGSLVQQLPTHPEWKSSLVTNLQRLALLYAATDRDACALELLGESVEKARDLVRLDPGNVDWRRNLSVSCHALADIHARNGRYPEARGWLKQDLQIAEALAREHPENEQYAIDYVESRQAEARLRTKMTANTSRLSHPHWIQPKNPFAAGRKIDDPRSFAGRRELISEAHRHLGAGRHLFVGGERGVGKTSFATQLRLILNGHEIARERFDIPPDAPRRLTVSFSCDGSENVVRLTHRLANRLLHALNVSHEKREKSYKFKIGTAWLGAETTTTSRDTFSAGIVDEFVDLIDEVFREFPEIQRTGVVFLIDELDLVLELQGVGRWLKSLIESLQDRGFTQVQFVLVGIRDTLDDLMSEHPSLQRFLLPTLLPLMPRSEIMLLCRLALDRQEQRPFIFAPEMSAQDIVRTCNEIVSQRNAMSRAGSRSTIPLLEHDPSLSRDEVIERCSAFLAPLQDSTIVFDAAVLAQIADFAAGHPHSAHLLGGVLFDRALSELEEECRYEDQLVTHTQSGLKLISPPKKVCTPIYLQSVVREVAKRFRAKEYAAAKKLLHNRRAEAMLSASAAFDNLTFGLQQLQDATGIKRTEARLTLDKLVAAKIFTRVDADMFEFREPLFRFHLRLAQESDRLELLAERARKAAKKAPAHVNGSASRLDLTPAEQEERSALEAEFLLVEHERRLRRHNDVQTELE